MSAENEALREFSYEIARRIADLTFDYIEKNQQDFIEEYGDLEYQWDEVYKDHSIYEDYKSKNYSIWDINKGVRYDNATLSFVRAFWDSIKKPVEIFISGQIKKLKDHERKAIWYQTDAGINWRYPENGDDSNPVHISDEDILNYIVNLHLFSRGDGWLNKRIEAILDKRLTDFLDRKFIEKSSE
jgi:hypothetical protein